MLWRIVSKSTRIQCNTQFMHINCADNIQYDKYLKFEELFDCVHELWVKKYVDVGCQRVIVLHLHTSWWILDHTAFQNLAMVLMQFFSFESLVRFSEIKMGWFASLLWKARKTLLILSQPLLQVADQRVDFPRHSQFADIQNLSGELLEFHKTIAKGGDILLVSWINVRSKTPLSASENMWKYMWKCPCVTLCVATIDDSDALL